MKLLRKLFALPDYLILIVSGFLVLTTFRFTVEILLSNEKAGYFTLFKTGLFISFFNTVFSLLIFHKYIPKKNPQT